MADTRVRLDRLLVQRGYLSSRNRAQRAIEAGNVWVDGAPETQVSRRLSPDAPLCVKSLDPYVSRGSHKLEKAFQAFSLPVCGRTVVDVGASTGGFTQRLLEAGATRVYALDVGTDQLADSLGADHRVINMEGTHIKAVDRSTFAHPLQMATVDVSFLSVTHVLPVLMDVLEPTSPVVILIKPQFEVGPSGVGKGGIVREAEIHRNVLQDVLVVAQAQGFVLVGLDHSPVFEARANLEFLALLYTPPLPEGVIEIEACEREILIHRVVAAAHEERDTFRS